MNAMYYDPFREEVLDFCNGINDAIEGVVRTVRPTHASLKEDPVRMLRAIRLAARHGFTMTKGYGGFVACSLERWRQRRPDASRKRSRR